MNIFNMDSQASEYVTGLDGRVYQSNGHDISQLGQTGDFQLQEIKIPANVLPVSRVAMLMFGQATGTCRWWGNLTPPCWGGGLSLACDGRAWGGSLSWAAAERWWGDPEPEEGWHLRDQARDTWTIGQRQTNKQTGRPGAGSDLSQVLDVLPLLGMVWRWGHCRQRDSERLERKIQELLNFHPFPHVLFQSCIHLYPSQSAWWWEEPRLQVWKLDLR